MKKILCPTDFSETAHKATAYAAKLAQKTGAQLILFHVQSLWNAIPANVIWGKFITLKAVKEQLDELSLEITKVYKISCYGEVHANNHLSISTIIADTSNHYDLVVMGTDGPDTFSEFFLGSNTYRVIKTSRVPVLLVPAGYEFQDIADIVYAVDYFHDQRLELNQLIQWAEPLQATVTILQVMNQPYDKGSEEKWNEAQIHLKKFYGARIALRFTTQFSDQPIEAFDSYTSHNPCDALAVCTRDHTLIEKLVHNSVIRQLSAVAQKPVFVFHH